jgi:hypothetical protein
MYTVELVSEGIFMKLLIVDDENGATGILYHLRRQARENIPHLFMV